MQRIIEIEETNNIDLQNWKKSTCKQANFTEQHDQTPMAKSFIQFLQNQMQNIISFK